MSETARAVPETPALRSLAVKALKDCDGNVTKAGREDQMRIAPLCRYCGKPIAKKTRQVYLHRTQEHLDLAGKAITWARHILASAKTIAECRRLTNNHVLSVSRRGYYSEAGEAGDIDFFTEWDGESYAKTSFCNGNHARWFAEAVAEQKPDLGMPAFHEARKARAPKAEAA